MTQFFKRMLYTANTPNFLLITYHAFTSITFYKPFWNLLLFSYSCPAFFPIALPYPVPHHCHSQSPHHLCPWVLYSHSFVCLFPFYPHYPPPLWSLSALFFTSKSLVLCCLDLFIFEHAVETKFPVRKIDSHIYSFNNQLTWYTKGMLFFKGIFLMFL